MLAYLVLRSEVGASADEIVDAVWPDPTTQPSRSNLRLHLSRLRKALVPEGDVNPIPSNSSRYVLDTGAIAVDSAELQQIVEDPNASLAQLDRCVALRRDTPFADIDDLPVLAAERARLDALHLRGIERWAGAHWAAGSASQTIDRLHATSAAFPYAEGPARCLVRALHRSGHTRDALNLHDAFSRRLRDDVGLDPSPSFAAFASAILHGDAEFDVDDASQPTHPASTPDPLVDPQLDRFGDHACRGREEDTRWIVDAVLDTGHQSSAVLLVGDAGIGKSRVLAAAAEELSSRGVATMYGRASGADIAYEPWSAIVRSLRRRLPGGALEQLPRFVLDALGALDPLVAPEPADAVGRSLDPHLLPGALAELFELATATGPALVALEDLHVMDHASRQLLSALVSVATPNTTIVITSRPLTSGAADPLHDELVDHHRARTLTGLSASAVEAMLADMTPGIASDLTIDAGAALAERLRRLSGGNPLILRQMVSRSDTQAFADELVVHEGRLDDVIHGSLATLPDQCLRALAVAAVCGLEFDVNTVSETLNCSVEEVLGDLAIPIRRQIITNPDQHGRAGFTHATFHHWCHESSTGPQRRRLHALLATRSGAGNDASAEIRRAWHALEAGDALDIEALLDIAQAAADALSRQGGHDQLTDLVDRVIQASPLRVEDPHVLLHRARALSRLGRWDEGRAEFLSLWERADRDGDLDLMTRVALEIDDAGRNVRLVGDRVRLLDEVLDRHRRDGSMEQPGAILAAAEYIGEAIQYGRGLDGTASRDIERFADETLQRARRGEDPTVVAAALFARSAASSWRPASTERLAWLDEARIHASSAGDLMRMHHVAGTLVRNHFELADSVAASEAADDHDRAASVSRHPRVSWFAKLRDTTLAQMRGDFDDAAARAQDMFDYGARFELPDNDGGYGSVMFMQLHHLGQLAELRPLVDAQVELAPHNPLWVAGAALAAQADGDRTAGRHHLRGLVDALDEVPRNEFWPALLCLLSDAASGLDDAECARKLWPELEPWSGRFISLGMMISTMGPADRYLALLADTLGQPSTQLRTRARILSDRVGATAWSTRISHDEAGVR